MKPEILERASKVELLVLDVDGVLTDGGLYYGPDGEALKRFNVHDGAGIKAVLDAGIRVAVISARQTRAVDARMAELGVTDVCQGAADKLAVLEGLIEQAGIELSSVACVGDDVADVDMLTSVGLAIAVGNAQQEAREAAHYCTVAHGGHGAVREVCEMLLVAR